MSKKDIDFTKVSLPADEFDAMMRRALDAPPPADRVEERRVKTDRKPSADKTKSKNV